MMTRLQRVVIALMAASPAARLHFNGGSLNVHQRSPEEASSLFLQDNMIYDVRSEAARSAQQDGDRHTSIEQASAHSFGSLRAEPLLSKPLPPLATPTSGELRNTAFVAYVLNLDSRPARWAAMQEAWAAVRSVRLHRVQATPHYASPDGAFIISGCATSLYRLLNDSMSLEQGMQIVLYLEDDAVPRPDFDERFPAILEYARTHLDDWHIINLGTIAGFASLLADEHDTRANIFQLRSPNLLRSSVWNAGHALLFNLCAMPRLHQHLASMLQRHLAEMESRPDWVLSRDAQLVSLVAVPSLVTQSPGVSDNAAVTQEHTVTRNFSNLFDEADVQLTEVKMGLSSSSWPAAKVYTSLEYGSLMMPHYDPAWTSIHVRDVVAHVHQQEHALAALPHIQATALTGCERVHMEKALVQQAWGDVRSINLTLGVCPGLEVGQLHVRDLWSVASGLRTCAHTLCSKDSGSTLYGNHAGTLLLMDEYAIPAWDFDERLASVLKHLSHVQDWYTVVLGAAGLPRDFCASNSSDCFFAVHSDTFLGATSVPNASALLLNCRHQLSWPTAVTGQLAKETLVAVPSITFMRNYQTLHGDGSISNTYLHHRSQEWGRLVSNVQKTLLDTGKVGATIVRNAGSSEWELLATD